ncbi:MAG: hypothetical protein K2Q22_12265, partial [Cytophagales bacterium]|nr:hypothetical protein [Cytophagales bacterium]
SNNISLTVNPLLTPVANIAASSVSVCSGTGIRLTASGVNLGSSPAYSWSVNGTVLGVGATLVYVPKDNDFVKLIATASGTGTGCLTSGNAQASQLINVDPIPSASLSISASANPVCSGTGVTFNANPVNLGTANAFRWYVNGILKASTAASFTYIPSNNDLVMATVTAGGALPTCLNQLTASSSGIRTVVNATIPTSVSIQASSNTVCLGQSVLFTSSASGTGSNPSYTWLVNNAIRQTGTTASFTYFPIQNDLVKVSMTPGGLGTACITGGQTTSLGIGITVTNTVTSSVSIASSAISVCSGSTVTFTASGANAGTAPAYSWLVNGQLVSVGKNYTYSPADGDVVKAKMNVGTGAACVVNPVLTSGGISLNVIPIEIPDVVSMANKTSVCAGEMVSMTATGLFAGTNPSYSWWVNGQKKSTGSTYSYVPSNNDQVMAVVSVGGLNTACLAYSTATTDGISFQVTPLVFPAIAIVADKNGICSGTGVSFTSISANAGSSPQVTWLVNGQVKAVGETFDYSPSPSDLIKAILFTNGGEMACTARTTATSNGISMQVSALRFPTVTISKPQGTLCVGSTITLQANISQSGPSPLVQWFTNDTLAGQGNTITFIPSNRDQVYAFLKVDTTGYPCYARLDTTSEILDLNVTETVFPAVTIQSSLASVCSGAGIVFTATGINGGTLPSYHWLVNGDSIASGNQFSYIPSDQDQVNAVLTFGGAGTTCNDTMPVFSSPVIVSVLPIGNSPCALPAIGSISGPAMVAPNANPITYSVASGADSYNWNVPSGVTIIAGQGTSSITVSFGNTVNGFISVTASNSHGSVSDSLQIQTSPITDLGNGEGERGFHLFPNPSLESFNLEMGDFERGNYSIEVMDLNGKALIHLEASSDKIIKD